MDDTDCLYRCSAYLGVEFYQWLLRADYLADSIDVIPDVLYLQRLQTSPPYPESTKGPWGLVAEARNVSLLFPSHLLYFSYH